MIVPTWQATDTATLADPALEAEFRERGFVVLDLVGPEVVARIGDIAGGVYVDDREGFHASNLSRNHEYRHAVNREVTPILERAADGLFVDHVPYFSSFVVKWPGSDSSFPSHQDWNMVDETRFRSVNIFCPLVDTLARNGALHVLPGSHRVLRPIRCSPMPPAGCESVGWQVTPDEMEVVEVAVGQVLVFDHALLHCSPPNLTDEPRWGAVTAFRPRKAGLYHWYLPDPSSTTLEVFEVNTDFFADIDIGERPPGEPVRTDEFVWEPMTKEVLLARCDGPPTRPRGPVVLHDPDLQDQLDEHGWVVVDLFDDHQVTALDAAFESLPHRVSDGVSFASGFHATIIDDRPDYRRASHRAIEEVVAGPADRLLSGMSLAMTNWVTKEPGADAAPFHVDWTFVDEDRFRSVSLWVPLVDTDDETGCIGVVDGSHRQVDFVRAATHPTYQDTHEWARAMPGARTLHLRAGEAVVFDHRTVHFSMPHRGTSRRVALTCEYVPQGAELLHYELEGPDRFRRHVVTPEFFVTYTAGDDPVGRPGHVRVDHVSGRAFPSAAADEGAPVDDEPHGDVAVPETPTVDEQPLTTTDRAKVAFARVVPRRVRREIRPR